MGSQYLRPALLAVAFNLNDSKNAEKAAIKGSLEHQQALYNMMLFSSYVNHLWWGESIHYSIHKKLHGLTIPRDHRRLVEITINNEDIQKWD